MPSESQSVSSQPLPVFTQASFSHSDLHSLTRLLFSAHYALISFPKLSYSNLAFGGQSYGFSTCRCVTSTPRILNTPLPPDSLFWLFTATCSPPTQQPLASTPVPSDPADLSLPGCPTDGIGPCATSGAGGSLCTPGSQGCLSPAGSAGTHQSVDAPPPTPRTFWLFPVWGGDEQRLHTFLYRFVCEHSFLSSGQMPRRGLLGHVVRCLHRYKKLPRPERR